MKLRLFLLTMVTATLAACQHEPYTLRGKSVEIRLAEPEAGGPQMLRLTAISDKVIHVTATPDRKWHDKESLIVSPSPALSGTEKAESIRLDVKSEPANDSLQISTSAGCASARPTTKPSTASAAEAFSTFSFCKHKNTLTMTPRLHLEEEAARCLLCIDA